MIPNHISYSFLHILACPYAAWLRYEAALKGPTTPWLALGNAVHHALEHGYVGEGFELKNAISLFKTEYNRIVEDEEVFISYPQLKKLESDGIEMVERYYVQIQEDIIPKTPLALEKEFSIPVAGTHLVGRIDKIDFIPGYGYVVTDFKTGKTKPDPWNLRHNLQLTAYYWATKEIYGEFPQKVVWHHLRTGELLESERTPQDIMNLRDMIKNAMWMKENDIRHRIFHEQVCNFCDYEGSICDDTHLEQEILNKRLEVKDVD